MRAQARVHIYSVLHLYVCDDVQKKKKAYQDVEAYFIEKAVVSVQASFLDKIEKGEDSKHLAAFASLKSIDCK